MNIGTRISYEFEPGRFTQATVCAATLPAPAGCVWVRNDQNCMCLLNVTKDNVQAVTP